jgi:hypothetical protein
MPHAGLGLAHVQTTGVGQGSRPLGGPVPLGIVVATPLALDNGPRDLRHQCRVGTQLSNRRRSRANAEVSHGPALLSRRIGDAYGDGDTKFSTSFDEVFHAERVRIILWVPKISFRVV